MSRLALDQSQSRSSTAVSSPTASTDYLVRSLAPAYMPEDLVASSASAGSAAGPSNSGSTSSLRRSRRLSERSVAQSVRNEANQSHAMLTPTAYAAPTGPPPQPIPSHLLRSGRPSEEHAPSITPSAMEAGHAKDMKTCHADASGLREKCDTDALVGKAWPPWKREDGWRGWRSEWVKKEALVVPLVVQAFSAGVLDATTYADFMTFASNQTGNTILLCVSVAGTVEVIIKLTAISLGAFLSAAFIFGHLGHYFGLRNRGWIMVTTTWQIITLLLAAILVSPHGPAIFHIGGAHEWFILFLFAHMSGAQVAQARQSSNQELPTAPMTSSYVDLMSEKYLFVGFRHKKAGPRNRKLAYTMSMIIGGLLGAVIHRFAGSWEVVVVTMLLKVVVLGLICRAKADDKGI